MLSASHNPAPDNGIKFFARGGVKLPDAVEDEIEAHLAACRPRRAGDLPRPASAGSRDAPTERERYLDHCWPPGVAASPGTAQRARRWPGCGSSSTARTAPPPRSRRGCCGGPAPTSSRSASSPTGSTSTQGCGSTNLDTLSAAVAEHGARRRHRARRRRGPLPGGRRGRPGDRRRPDPGRAGAGAGATGAARRRHRRRHGHVQPRLPAARCATPGSTWSRRRSATGTCSRPCGTGSYVLGGEQSGHIIMLDHATTGDGMLTAPAPAGHGAPARRCRWPSWPR